MDEIHFHRTDRRKVLFPLSYEKGNDKSAGVDDCAYIDNVERKPWGWMPLAGM